MIDLKVSPLPWSAKHAAVYDANGSVLVVCTQGTVVRNDKQMDMNTAVLMSAAGDMLEALEAVNKLIAEASTTGFNCHDGDWAERLFHSQQATSAAMAKARGRDVSAKTIRRTAAAKLVDDQRQKKDGGE